MLAAAVDATEGVRLFAPTETTVVCFTATDVDLFVLADELAARDWHTQPQLSYGDLPPTIHLTVTAAVGPTAGQFGPDLADAVAAARGRGPVELPSLPALTPDQVAPALVAGLADSLGLAGRDFGRMAGVNTVLNACPPALREALLTGFLSLLQQAED